MQDSATAMVDVMYAVQYLHDIGVVHRHLKVRDPNASELPRLASQDRSQPCDVLMHRRARQMENLMYASNDQSAPAYNRIKVECRRT